MTNLTNIITTQENNKELQMYGCTDVIIHSKLQDRDIKKFVIDTDFFTHMSIDEAINFLNSAKNRGCEYIKTIKD